MNRTDHFYSMDKRVMKTEYNSNSTNYPPLNYTYYYIQKDKKSKIKITNQKYASFLHKLLDEDHPKKKISGQMSKASNNFSSRNKNFFSKTKSVHSLSKANYANYDLSNSSYKKRTTKPKLSQNNELDCLSQEKHLKKLYGYDQSFFKIKRLVKSNKKINLKKYQDNIVKISGKHLSKENMMRFINELKEIRTTAEVVKPLPPVNFPALIIHTLKENEEDKKTNNNKRYSEMDDYEKELYKIKETDKKNKILYKRDINMKKIFKIYDLMPQYLVDAIKKNKSKIYTKI